jgi:hypothetical protein
MNYTLVFENDERKVTFGFKAEGMDDILGALPDFLKAVGFELDASDGIFVLDEEDQAIMLNAYEELYKKTGL